MFTAAEIKYLDSKPRPANWNEMGSSAKDMWEERAIAAAHRFGKIEES